MIENKLGKIASKVAAAVPKMLNGKKRATNKVSTVIRKTVFALPSRVMASKGIISGDTTTSSAIALSEDRSDEEGDKSILERIKEAWENTGLIRGTVTTGAIIYQKETTFKILDFILQIGKIALEEYPIRIWQLELIGSMSELAKQLMEDSKKEETPQTQDSIKRGVRISREVEEERLESIGRDFVLTEEDKDRIAQFKRETIKNVKNDLTYQDKKEIALSSLERIMGEAVEAGWEFGVGIGKSKKFFGVVEGAVVGKLITFNGEYKEGDWEPYAVFGELDVEVSIFEKYFKTGGYVRNVLDSNSREGANVETSIDFLGMIKPKGEVIKAIPGFDWEEFAKQYKITIGAQAYMFVGGGGEMSINPYKVCTIIWDETEKKKQDKE